MKKIALCLSLLIISSHCYAQEVITGFEDKDLPVLNEELRLKDAEIIDLKDRVDVLEADVDTAAATQAEQETATATDAYVSPGRQQYHPSAPKAWCMFNGGTAGTNAPTVGYNVTSVERVSAGLYNITFTTAFSSTNYAVVGTADYTDSNSNKVMITALTSSSVCQITVTDSSNNVNDCAIVCIAAFGDQ